MLVLFPKRILAVFTDNSMPRRDWTKYNKPPDTVRKANVAKWKADNIRRRAREQAAARTG